MPLLLGLDLGTTTITALAVESTTGHVVAKHTQPNDAECTPPATKIRGHLEYDPTRISAIALGCLEALRTDLPTAPVVLGLTGQQHGCLLRDANGGATPLVNWQDQRGNETYPGTAHTFVAEMRQRLDAVYPRCGCRVANGYMATTLFWHIAHGTSLANRTACFLADDLAARLTHEPPATDPTFAASAGVFDVARQTWDEAALDALGLPRSVFPTVFPSGTVLGRLRAPELAAWHGLPVCVPMGDNQASVFGSLREPTTSVVVNIGTGGQVSVVLPSYLFVEHLETRPFPTGYLLTSVGLAGGRAYAALEQFLRRVGRTFFGAEGGSLYEQLNAMAATIPPGADGLRCEPFFGGTRAEPTRRAEFTGLSFENFTPAHLARALLEGTAEAVATGYGLMQPHLPTPRTTLIGAGNGIRENPLLANLIATRFGLRMHVPQHREEAAYGAALVAGVGVGVFGSWSEATTRIGYEPAPA